MTTRTRAQITSRMNAMLFGTVEDGLQALREGLEDARQDDLDDEVADGVRERGITPNM